MRVTIEFSNGDKFGAAFPDDAATEDIVDAVRFTLEQQATQ